VANIFSEIILLIDVYFTDVHKLIYVYVMKLCIYYLIDNLRLFQIMKRQKHVLVKFIYEKLYLLL